MKDSIVTSFRLSRDTHSLVSQVCESRSETLGTFIRRAILKELANLSFLPDEQKKALGIEVPDEASTGGQ